MPFNRPTQDQIVYRIRADLEAEFPGADARLRETYERVMSKAVAKSSNYQHAHLDWIQRQLFADTAEDEYIGQFAYIFGVSNGQGGFGYKPATYASGTVQVAGNSPGTISDGTIMTRPDGTRYVVDGDYNYPNPDIQTTLDVSIIAEDAGAGGNADGGTTLTFEGAIADVQEEGTVQDPVGITGGADRESTDALRLRVLDKIRAAGAGGGPGDFATWALEASSAVTRAWELPQYGGNPATVLVLIANDNLTGVVPDADTVLTVQNYLQKKTTSNGRTVITGKAPVSTDTTAQAIAVKFLNYAATVELDSDTTQAVARASIEAEVKAMLRRRVDLEGPGLSITTAQILAAIMRGTGVVDAELTSPIADVTHTATQIPIVGTFTPTWS